MNAHPVESILRLIRASRLALVVAFCATLGYAAHADTILHIDRGGLAPTGAPQASAAVTTVGSSRASKLTLGLDSLSVEYQAFRQAVASGVAPAGTFTPTRSMATLIGTTVLIDAVAAHDAR
jgi:hypothetical protein